MTIKRGAFFAAGREIVDEFEKKLAWFFVRYGSWDTVEQPAHVENGEVISFDFQCHCDDPNPDQEFLVIGRLSDMISRQFNSMTSDEGKILHLSPQVAPDKFGIVIPPEYKGDVLGLWRFDIQSTQKEN